MSIPLITIGFIVTGVSTLFLAVVLFLRGAHKEYPLFFGFVAVSYVVLSAFIAGSFLNSVRLFSFTLSPNFVLSTNLSWGLLLPILALSALYEVFCARFETRGNWVALPFAFWGAVTILTVPVVFFFGWPLIQDPHAEPLLAGYTVLRVLAGVVAGALVIPLVVVSWRTRDWRRYPLGIATGFVVSFASAFAFRTQSMYATSGDRFAVYGSLVCYLLGVLIWIFTFRRHPGRNPNVRPGEISAKATTSLILGVLAFPSGIVASILGTPQFEQEGLGVHVAIFLLWAFMVTIASVVLGHLALKDIRKSQGSRKGASMGLAGLIMSYAEMAIMIALLAAFHVMFGR